MKQKLFVIFASLLLLVVSTSVIWAQQSNGITSPRDNAEVEGVVLIEGTATNPDLLRYELAFFKEFDPLGEWVVFASGEAPVVNGVLATWDTTVGRDAGAPFYPDGTYRLRLRVVRRDSNYDEYFVMGISLKNDQPTPTPSATPDAAPDQVASPVATSAIVVPTELPTLTPFPTPTKRPTAVADAETSDDQTRIEDQDGSFLNLEGEFRSDQIKGGFLLGVKITLGCFAGLAGYLLLRLLLRWGLARIQMLDLPPRRRE